MKTIDINVICNFKFTNHNLIEACKNIEDVIDYTYKNCDNIKIGVVNFLFSKRDESKYFNVGKIANFNFKSKIHYIDDETISGIFNKMPKQNSDYIALYSSTIFWYNDHLIESVKQMELQKTKWNISILELRSDYLLVNNEPFNYRIPESKETIEEAVIGEIVVETRSFAKLDFTKAVYNFNGFDQFLVGKMLLDNVGKCSVTKHSTVKMHSELNENIYSEIAEEENSFFDETLIHKDHENTLFFSVICDITNIKHHNDFFLLVNSLKSQKFPDHMYEIIMVSNFDSASIYVPFDELQKIVKNVQIRYISNVVQDEYGDYSSVVYNEAIKLAKGKYITYFNIKEKFIYTPFYLSELYKLYNLKRNIVWTYSNYFDIVNYVRRHSNISVPHKNNLYYTLISHINDGKNFYANVSLIDKYSNNNKCSGLLNLINSFTHKKQQGFVIPKAQIQKVG